jgi:large subunit ribosomal protein L22
MSSVETPHNVRAEARYVRAAPRKTQLVVEQIRGRPVPEARTILAFMTRDAARDVEKVLSSAVANAEANHGLVGDELYVALATAGAGPTLKRWRARARGRVARIRKRTSHIRIELAALPEHALPAPPPAPEPKAEPTEAKPAARKKAAAAKPKAETKPKTTRKATAKPKATAEKPKAAKPAPKPKTTRTKKAEEN